MHNPPTVPSDEELMKDIKETLKTYKYDEYLQMAIQDYLLNFGRRVRDRTREAERAAMHVERNRLMAAERKAHCDWMEAGMRAGFVFGVSPTGFTVEHDPAMAAEIAKGNEEGSHDKQ